MDELGLLKAFRLEDAEPNGAREYARSRLRTKIARDRRRQRRGLVALALVGAAIAAGTAYGVVRELVVGAPAPEEVKEALARFGHEAELIPYPRPEDPRVEERPRGDTDDRRDDVVRGGADQRGRRGGQAGVNAWRRSGLR